MSLEEILTKQSEAFVERTLREDVLLSGYPFVCTCPTATAKRRLRQPGKGEGEGGEVNAVRIVYSLLCVDNETVFLFSLRIAFFICTVVK